MRIKKVSKKSCNLIKNDYITYVTVSDLLYFNHYNNGLRTTGGSVVWWTTRVH